jgi:FKBP-type peptidyl-prolyl cis-trans isomerase SlpA
MVHASDDVAVHPRPADAPRVTADSHVTLHYRVALRDADGDREVISTLGGSPATVQIGGGTLPPALENCLLGLAEGDTAQFTLPPDAYGERSPQLVQTLTRATFDANADPDGAYVPGDVVEFNGPEGRRFTGVLKSLDMQRVVVDFNHPLAGQPLVFEARVIGVL